MTFRCYAARTGTRVPKIRPSRVGGLFHVSAAERESTQRRRWRRRYSPLPQAVSHDVDRPRTVRRRTGRWTRRNRHRHQGAVVSKPVYTTETPLACAVGIPDCNCDYIGPDICDLLGLPRGTVNEFCECHDCYVCGEINCNGHP